MRSIFVGIEYAGKSTLIDLLAQYYRRLNRPVHRDDHFSIPDATLSPSSRALMAGFPADVKERMQRMQIHYHVDILRKYECPVLAGWHIEEAVYSAQYGADGGLYYKEYGYGFQRLYEAAVLEFHLPDLVMIHVTASGAAIRQRMKDRPHEYQIIKEEDIAALEQRFVDEVDRSLFTHLGRTVVLDTTDRTPQESLDELLLRSEPLVTPGEIALRSLPLPAGEPEVRYEHGVRRVVRKAQ
jgi:hypothetical protein